MGHQPLGLASPMAFLERAGFRPAAHDLAASTLDEGAVGRARFVGISVPMHTAMRLGVRAAARVREWNPAAHICFYGLYAPLNRALLAAAGEGERPLADSVIGGEYEQALVDAVTALEAGAAPVAEPVVPLERLRFAVPSRAQLAPLARYARRVASDGSEAPAGYTEASRGCLHTCRHCPIPAVYEGRFFVVPVDVVMADVRAQVAAGAAHITLGDPDFLNGPRHALAVARALHAEFPSLTFDATIKIEHLLRHRELLAELAAAGCLFIVTAAESLSPRVLDILDKGHGPADLDAALGLARAAGITLRPTWVPFSPWSTLDEHVALLDYLVTRRLLGAVDPIQLTIRLLVPPGSLLVEHPEMRPHLGPLDPASLSYRWAHPDPRMDALQRASARLVHDAERDGRDPLAVHADLRRLAHEVAGLHPPAPAVYFPTEGAPKLTESWFC